MLSFALIQGKELKTNTPTVCILSFCHLIDNPFFLFLLEIPLNPCQQFCQASSYVAQVEVENGTACRDSLRSFDVCILGECQVQTEKQGVKKGNTLETY